MKRNWNGHPTTWLPSRRCGSRYLDLRLVGERVVRRNHLSIGTIRTASDLVFADRNGDLSISLAYLAASDVHVSDSVDDVARVDDLHRVDAQEPTLPQEHAKGDQRNATHG